MLCNGGTLDSIPESEVRLFVNQWTLGLGSPEAPVIVMGTEHAYETTDPDYLASLLLESCASAIMWLCNLGSDFVAHICRDPSYGDPGFRPYHLSPIDYYQAPGRRLRGNYTWKCVAAAVGVELGQLGTTTYQIERSAAPARQQIGGSAPQPERAAFLMNAIEVLRDTADVLILHGAVDRPPYAAIDELIVMRFLDVQQIPVPREENIAGQRLKWWRVGNKTAIGSRALSGPISNQYLARIRDLVG